MSLRPLFQSPCRSRFRPPQFFRLAVTGRAREEVASGENGRNRLRLDRRGNGVTLFGDRTQKRFGQPE